MKINEIRKDYEGWYTNALYLGDASERVRVLKACGRTQLALLTATTYGLQQEVEALSANSEVSVEAEANATMLRPPIPVYGGDSAWPTLTRAKGFFDTAAAGTTAATATKASTAGAAAAMMDTESGDAGGADGWGDDSDEEAEAVGDEKEGEIPCSPHAHSCQ